MNLAPAVIDIVLPIFGVVAIGYLVGMRRWMDSDAVRGLSLYVFNVAVPLLLFKTMSAVDLPEVIPWRALMGYFGCALGLLIGVFVISRWRYQSASEAGVFAFACSYGNFIPLGIPLVMMAFGEAATVPLVLLVAFQAPLFFPIMIVIQELAKDENARGQIGWTALKSILKNQFLIGIGLGAFVNAAQVSLPTPVVGILDLIGRSAGPGALFALGAALSFYPIRGVLRGATLVVLIKNLLLPALVWWVVHLLDLPAVWRAVLIVMAALPVGINSYLFAERYGALQPLAGSAVVISTALSVFTLSLVLTWVAL